MPPTAGKFFFLKSKSSNLYLDACASNEPDKVSPGKTEVTLSTKRSLEKGGDTKSSQVWYWDAITSTLRNSVYNLCLDAKEEQNAVSNFLDLQTSMDYKDNVKKREKSFSFSASLLARYSPKPRRGSLSPITPPVGPVEVKFPQQWRFNKTRQTIENTVNEEVVLEVAAESTGAGAVVRAHHLSLRPCQLWVMEPIPARYMYICSVANEGHVMDVLGGKASAGVLVGLYVKKKCNGGSNSQLWFEDGMGNLRTKLNDKLVLHATGSSLKTELADGTEQRWVICGNRIVSTLDHRYVISLARKRNSFSIDENDTLYLCSSLYQGFESQHWEFVYV